MTSAAIGQCTLEVSRLFAADEANELPPAEPRAGLDPETAQKLKKKFLEHVAQARSKQKVDGIVVQLVVGSDFD